MALQDIITAIVSQADREIAALREAHAQRIRRMRGKHEAALRALQENTAQQIETKKSQLLLKMKTHAQVERRNKLSSVKQSVINAAFAEALAMLTTLPDEKIEPLLRACLQRIKGHGVIRASKRHEGLLKRIAPKEQFTVETDPNAIGGFRFIGKTAEADFTLEHIVHGVLRPMKELDVAHLLLGTNA